MANPPARSSLRASPAANARATALPVRCSSNQSAARAREIIAREGMNGAFNDDESTPILTYCLLKVGDISGYCPLYLERLMNM